MAQRISRKVTAFIVRNIYDQPEILLINHPNTKYQFPAGTVNRKETFKNAALREAKEETDLNDLFLIAELGHIAKKYNKYTRILKKADIYSRPTKIASKFGKLRGGLKVKILQTQGEFIQVKYQEKDQTTKEQNTMVQIIGWIRKELTSQKQERHFYLLGTRNTSRESWTHLADHHYFSLEWHPIDNLPELGKTQTKWLRKYKNQITSELKN